MGEIVLTLADLKELVDRMENQAEYHNMHSYVTVEIIAYPNGRRFVAFEQPCHYAECNSTYYHFDEKE